MTTPRRPIPQPACTQMAAPAVPLPRSRPDVPCRVGSDASNAHAESEPQIDLAAVAEDDQLVEDLRAGTIPPTADQIAHLLAAWRAEVTRAT